MLVLWFQSSLALGQSLDKSVDITKPLLQAEPQRVHPEVTNLSASRSLDFLIGHGELRALYDSNGFAACAPQAFGNDFVATNWQNSARFCLKNAKESYAAQAPRTALKSDLFGVAEHPSTQAKPGQLLHNVSDRVLMQSLNTVASARSSFLGALIAGQIQFSVPMDGSLGQFAPAKRERVAYKVVYEHPTQKEEALFTKVALASSAESSSLSGDSPSFVARGQTQNALKNKMIGPAQPTKKLVELRESDSAQQGKVSPPDQASGAQRDALRRSKDYRYQASSLLGLSGPVFYNLTGKFDRAGASRPQDVKFSIFESFASVLFLDLQPFTDQKLEKTVSYGYVVPFHNSRFRVQYFSNQAPTVYHLENRDARSVIIFTLEEKTDKMKMEVGYLL